MQLQPDNRHLYAIIVFILIRSQSILVLPFADLRKHCCSADLDQEYASFAKQEQDLSTISMVSLRDKSNVNTGVCHIPCREECCIAGDSTDLLRPVCCVGVWRRRALILSHSCNYVVGTCQSLSVIAAALGLRDLFWNGITDGHYRPSVGNRSRL